MQGQAASITSLQLVPFRDVLDNVVQEAHSGLQQLSERLPGLSDEERKRQLLQHLQTTRQRLQRLHVCAQWAHKAKAVNTCREVLKAAQDHGAAFVHTADELFRLHEELRFCRAPLFDVSTALHITQSGTYRLLPRLIEDELAQPGQRLERPGELDDAQRAQRQRDALRRVDFLLRSKLLASELPSGMRVLRVRGGKTSVAAAGGQYTAQLTLVPAPRDDVTLTKYRPPGETEDAAAGGKQDHEVKQQAPDGQPSSSAAAARPSSSAAAAAVAGTAAEQRQGADCWRWQLLSFVLLPAAAGHDPPPLLPAQRVWLQQHIEQRMWAAADVEQLKRLGKQAWVAVPELPSTAKEQQQQQGKAASTAPLASSTPALSSGPAASQLDKGKQAVEVSEPSGQQQQQQQLGAGKGLPAYASNPLTAMHEILCQTAGRLALFSLLLSDARQLEGGSWKGSLKLSRAAAGSGLRFSYWQQLPCVSYAELQCLREGRTYEPEAAATVTGAGPAGPAAAAAAARQQQVAPAVEVSLQQDGSLAAASSPQLRHALTGEAVQLALPLDSAASLDADRLLLAAAAHNAAAQLAAVQAILQRSGKLAPAGIHADLALAVASSAAEGSSGAPPASPHLRLWCAGSLQLSLGVQLRTGRLLVLAGLTLLEGEQGSEAAALVAALQQQLDQLRREAMSQPLPPGSSRGMLAAKLVADAVARLSVQLSMRRRMDAAAAAAAACGLQRGALPQQLMEAHMRQLAFLQAPLTSNTLSLALPAFPPPAEMLGWARQHQQRRVGGGGGPSDSGATRCFLLIDFGDPSEVAAATAAAAAAAGDTGGAAVSPAAGAAGEQAPPRMLLAVCSCTARGTVTRVLRLAELPAHATAGQQAAGAAAGGGAATMSRKRRASDAAEEAAAEEQPAEAEFETTLAAAAAWCRRRAGWEALRSQLVLLPVQHAEEQLLGQPQRQVIRLPKAPVLTQLESWAVAKLAAADRGTAAPGPASKPAATMQLEEGQAAGAGAWRVDLASAYFAHLVPLLGQQLLRLAPPAPDAQHIAAHGSGLTLRYSLAQGHSVLTAITDLVRLGMLHLCLTRLAGCMAANPLASHPAKAAASHRDSLGLPLEDVEIAGSIERPSNGGLANGQQLQAPGGTAVSQAGASLAWPLPGCGSVQLQEAGLTHMVLLVAPPPLPEGLQHLVQPPAVRLTVSWDNTLLNSSSTSSSSSGASYRASGRPAAAGAAAPRRGSGTTAGPVAGAAAAAAAAAMPAGTAAVGEGARGALRHIRCRVSAQPPMPEPVTAALAHQLEAGRVDLFLDSLCLAAHAACAAARQLTLEAQRATGLLPSALRLVGAPVPPPGGAAASAPAAPAAGSSALRLRAHLQQGGLAASLCLGFHAGGYTLVQLAPGPNAAASAAASLWMPPLWGRMAKSVPTFAVVEAAPVPGGGGQPGEPQRALQQQQLHQAWVHHSGLSEALAGIMRAVAATAAEAC